jgi:hypothetical protein
MVEVHARFKQGAPNKIGVIRKTFELLAISNDSVNSHNLDGSSSKNVHNVKENHSKLNVVQIKICEIYV